MIPASRTHLHRFCVCLTAFGEVEAPRQYCTRSPPSLPWTAPPQRLSTRTPQKRGWFARLMCITTEIEKGASPGWYTVSIEM
ncbi:hypothetical protein PYCCODRAFT_552371 [Trametes coccinea BRFM310]|uniref:Uncharacterized protein n=1 Tax=Trametes coccinea (strain BRFM310) TaxID=1353009 RepID=A0A1Y2IJ82_TRAC3|nr:hypothetical protein PYCCODRAFT_552371 [Trametes coccinea BRFM310]